MADDKSPDEIRAEIDQTRADLNTKLSALTSRVTETVDSAKETVESARATVENTVESVKDTVEETVESVKKSFDFSKQIDAHPWAMVGGAVAVGFVLGRVLTSESPRTAFSSTAEPMADASPRHTPPPAAREHHTPSPTAKWMSDVVHSLVDVESVKRQGFEAVKGFLTGLAMQAVGPVMQAARDMKAQAEGPANRHDPYRRTSAVGHTNGI